MLMLSMPTPYFKLPLSKVLHQVNGQQRGEEGGVRAKFGGFKFGYVNGNSCLSSADA